MKVTLKLVDAKNDVSGLDQKNKNKTSNYN